MTRAGLLRWLHTLPLRLFRKRYLFALPHSALVFARRTPYGGIQGMVEEANPIGGWSLWSDEMEMRWLALCYNRPSSGGLYGIDWQEVRP